MDAAYDNGGVSEQERNGLIEENGKKKKPSQHARTHTFQPSEDSKTIIKFITNELKLKIVQHSIM